MFLHKEYSFFYTFALAPILLIDPIIPTKIAPNMNNIYIYAGEVIWGKVFKNNLYLSKKSLKFNFINPKINDYYDFHNKLRNVCRKYVLRFHWRS